MKIKKLLTSFKNAFHGLVYVFKNEQNFRIQIFIAILVILGMFLFPLGKYEVIALLLLILLVLILELINSTFEIFIDVTRPRLHHKAKLIKDIMAGTVFISSLGALILGVIIFWPYIIELFIEK